MDKVEETRKKVRRKVAGLWEDFHSGNFMQRANGDVVLTDPWFLKPEPQAGGEGRDEGVRKEGPEDHRRVPKDMSRRIAKLSLEARHDAGDQRRPEQSQ